MTPMQPTDHHPRRLPGLPALTLTLLALLLSTEAAAQEAAPPLPSPMPDSASERFVFGSYGRVGLGSNLEGGIAAPVSIISHDPRLVERSYTELDFGYLHEIPNTKTTFNTRATLAFGEDLFHFDGEFEAKPAIRNLYLEAQGLHGTGVSVWAGSRMYRGDDIYLLDFWPLDEQNTVGGGAACRFGPDSEIRAHVGLNRLSDGYQTQTITVADDNLGTQDILFLDRARVVGSLRGEQHFGVTTRLRTKVVAYSEVHGIGGGTVRSREGAEDILPSDSGWLGGLEIGLYEPDSANHVNLFARFAAGLAAYDELAVPTDTALDMTTSGAQEVLVGFSGNFEPGDFGLLAGGYLRYAKDADPVEFDVDDGLEVGAAVRPAWFATRHLHLLTEANVQYLRPNGIDAETLSHDTPTVVQLALMPTISVDRGSFARPQLRLVYAASFLNDAARFTYATEDPRRVRSVQHFVGFVAEWWFNASRGG